MKFRRHLLQNKTFFIGNEELPIIPPERKGTCMVLNFEDIKERAIKSFYKQKRDLKIQNERLRDSYKLFWVLLNNALEVFKEIHNSPQEEDGI